MEVQILAHIYKLVEDLLHTDGCIVRSSKEKFRSSMPVRRSRNKLRGFLDMCIDDEGLITTLVKKSTEYVVYDICKLFG